MEEIKSLKIKDLPNWKEIKTFIKKLKNAMIPGISELNYEPDPVLTSELNAIIAEILKKGCHDSSVIQKLINDFQKETENISKTLYKDAHAIYMGDPAAHSIDEVILCYPGFYAIFLHRISHFFWNSGIRIFPRMISEYAHSKTGIDIHPGATIGNHFCIDHGTGIVIGESTVIGDHVKIYQGVTLGALSVSKDKAGKKRHPTIGNNVCIYSRTTILGGDTFIGDHSIIGGNVWLTHSVTSNSVVLNKSETILKIDETFINKELKI